MTSSIAFSVTGAHAAQAAPPGAGGSVGPVLAPISRPQAVTPDPSKLIHPSGVIPQVQRGQRPSRAITAGTNPNCTTCSPPLNFTRGAPVMGGFSGTPGHVTITPVYWAPSGYTYVTGTYKTIINGYLQNVAQASQTNTNVFSVSTQYYQQALSVGAGLQHIQYAITAGSEIDDPNAYPASGPGPGACTPAIGFTACVMDGALQTEVRARLTALGQPMDDAHLYLVLFPSGVETCFSSGGTPQCNTNTFCAYHSAAAAGKSYLVYANQPFPNLNACADPFNGAQAPNGDAAADTQVSMISHEANESITDWFGAWIDFAGFENGDECIHVYGVPQGVAGAYFNQVIGTGHYYTQDEFSNEDYALGRGDITTIGRTQVFGCVQHDELPTASFSGPASVGTTTNATFDGSASSDPDNLSPLSYSWSWGDGTPNGTGASPTHSFCSAGVYNVTLTVLDVDGWSNSVTHPVTVTQGSPVINAVSPSSGLWTGGTMVTITGCAFTGVTSVMFGSTPARAFAFVSDRQVSATSPSHPQGTVDINLATAGGPSATTAADQYTFTLFISPAVSGGGVLTSSPGASSGGAAGDDVFVVGTDRGLWHTRWNGSTFSGWVPGGGIITADPAALTLSATNTKVFVRGTDNGLWLSTWNGASFSTWTPLGGVLTSGPTADVLAGSAHIDVFGRGTDNQLWSRSSGDGGTTWGSWQPLGGGLLSDPGAVASSATGLDVVVRGTDSAVWIRAWNASTGWNSWATLGGLATSAPDVASCSSGHLDVFVRGSDNGLWQLGFNGVSWTGWVSLGGSWTSSPSAVCQPGTDIIDLFVRGTDKALWTESVPGT